MKKTKKKIERTEKFCEILYGIVNKSRDKSNHWFCKYILIKSTYK